MRVNQAIPQVLDKLEFPSQGDKQAVQKAMVSVWGDGVKIQKNLDDFLMGDMMAHAFLESIGLTMNGDGTGLRTSAPARPIRTTSSVATSTKKTAHAPKQDTTPPQGEKIKKPPRFQKPKVQPNSTRNQGLKKPKHKPTSQKLGKGKNFNIKDKLSFLNNMPDFGAMLTGRNRYIAIGVVLFLIVAGYFGASALGSPNSEYSYSPPSDTGGWNPDGVDDNSPNNAPPEAPQRTDAVDAGSSAWKGKSQWLQIILLFCLPLLMVIDTTQKRREILEDIRRGNDKSNRLKLIWIAPVAVILGCLILVKPEWFEFIMFGSVGPGLAIFFGMVICWGISYLMSEGDPSFPAAGLAIVALCHLLTTSKTGALLTVFGIPTTSAVYTIKGTVALISLNNLEAAKFGILIYILLATSLTLIIGNLLQDVKKNDLKSFVGIAVAIVGGGAIYAAGSYWQPATSLVVLLVAGLFGQAVDVDKFDEALMGGIVFGVILAIAFATPLT